MKNNTSTVKTVTVKKGQFWTIKDHGIRTVLVLRTERKTGMAVLENVDTKKISKCAVRRFLNGHFHLIQGQTEQVRKAA